MPEPQLRVGTIPWPGYEPLVLARELDLFPAQRIHTVEYVSSIQALRAFRNGAIDAIAASLDEVLLLEELGHEPQVVLVLASSHGADCVMSRSEVASLAELEGRRIGAEESTVAMYMLHRMLEQVGLTRENVHLEVTPLTTHVKAFQQGKLDAVVTFEPYCQRLAELGAHRLFDSSHLPGELVDVLVVSKKFMDAHPEHVDALVRGWFAALTWMKAHPQEAALQISPRLRMNEQQFSEAFSGVQFLDAQEQRAQLTGSRPRLHDTAGRLGELLLRKEILQKRPDASRVINPSALQRVLP
jgi:NitT/TauT family transport system substrate-binding protein